MLAIELGAGRKTLDDPIDPKSGLIFHRKIGDHVRSGEPIATLFSDRKEALERAASNLLGAVAISSREVRPGPRVLSYVDRNGARPWTTPVVH
jgi:pyrimidine-nucleoside phosphorylase